MFLVVSKDLVCIFAGLNEFGLLNDLWCFDLYASSWRQIEQKGDFVEARYRFGFTSYEENGTTFFAVYGGFGQDGRLGNLSM